MTNRQLHDLVSLCAVSSPDLLKVTLSDDIIPFVISNGMGPWLFHCLKNRHADMQLKDESLAALRQSYIQTTLANRQKLEVYREVREILRAEGIEMVALKGMALAFTVYPDEGLRPMGDMDLLVHESQVFQARDLLIAHGGKTNYVPRSALHEHVSAHVRPVIYKGVMIEFHQRLFALGNPLNLKIKQDQRFNDNHLNTNQVDPLHDVLFAYHLATHAYYGFQMKGMRLGWLVDLALLCQRQSQLGKFQQQVIELNPPIGSSIEQVFQWVEPFLAGGKEDWSVFPDVSIFRQPDQIKQTHRWLNLKDITRTPGLNNKLKLVIREFIPEKEYMQFRYGSNSWKAYRKRLLRI